MKEVNGFLKGNYIVSNAIKDDFKDHNDEFKKKAINSIGGSMVFVEREKMVWTGPEELKTEENNTDSKEKEGTDSPKSR